MVQSRIAPAPISRGMSVRKLPRASYDEIEGVCNHYLYGESVRRRGAAHRLLQGRHEDEGRRRRVAVEDLAHERATLLAPAQEAEVAAGARGCAAARTAMLEWAEDLRQVRRSRRRWWSSSCARRAPEIAAVARAARGDRGTPSPPRPRERVLAGHHHRRRLELGARPRAVRRRVVPPGARRCARGVARRRPAQRPARRDARPPRAAARGMPALWRRRAPVRADRRGGAPPRRRGRAGEPGAAGERGDAYAEPAPLWPRRWSPRPRGLRGVRRWILAPPSLRLPSLNCGLCHVSLTRLTSAGRR